MSTRQDTALSVFDRQRSFAFENTGFWKKKQHLVASVRPTSYLMDKDDLRSEDPLVFVPEASIKQLRYCFATSGTSGEPTFSFWTQEDWDLKISTIATTLRNHFELPRRIVALNCYAVNCLAGAIFTDVIRLLGGISIPSGYFHKDSESLCHLFNKLHCNTLIVGCADNSYKFSIGANRLFYEISLNNQQFNLEWWLSSGPIPEETLAFASRLQIPLISSFYGCSEVGFFSIGCRLDPTRYHVLEGDILVERAMDDQRDSDGGRYKILVSRVGGREAQNGIYKPHKGSQYLRYFPGDVATWTDSPCSCGHGSPTLSSVARSP